jgi:ribosomal protein S12 methylthiotransferase accessory factor
MAKTITVSFPGGKRLAAQVGAHTVYCDQSREEGGEDSAASPFELFLVSIATCAAYYAQGFSEKRGIATAGMALTLHAEFDEATRRYPRLEITLDLPPGFPEKYENAVVKAMETCFVKKHIVNPPEFALAVRRAGR